MKKKPLLLDVESFSRQPMSMMSYVETAELLFPKPLTPAEKAALRSVVIEADAWRGSMIGNPDTRALDRFDKRIARACGALRKMGVRPPVLVRRVK